MEKTPCTLKDRVTPDKIRVTAWEYSFNLFTTSSMAFSYDGERIYTDYGHTHKSLHRLHPDKSFLDFRYYPQHNLLSAWIYDSEDIRSQLLSFEEAYRRNPQPIPFNIDTVQLIFTSDGYITRCTFKELHDTILRIEPNDMYRVFHITPPSLKLLITDKNWKREYFKEGERAWIMKHGNIDPAYYHLLMYEE